MSFSKFNEIIDLSQNQISYQIIKTEKELFNLYFKKATRQDFKSHKLTSTKRRLSQLKTLVNFQLRKKNSNL